MNWQTELNSSLSWILTALFWVIVCFSVTTLALKQTTFGQKFWHIASPSINRRNGIKIIVIGVVYDDFARSALQRAQLFFL